MSQFCLGLLMLLAVPSGWFPASARTSRTRKRKKAMLECRVIVKEITTVGYPNKVALLDVELKNVSDKAIDIRYTFAPQSFNLRAEEKTGCRTGQLSKASAWTACLPILPNL